MINPVGSTPKTYTAKDVFAEAMRLMKDEVATMKKTPLSKNEEQKLEQLARSVSVEVLKEMRV